MPATTAATFDDLVASHLGRRLPSAMADAVTLAELPSGARDLIRRMLVLMQKARYPATDFNPFLTEVLTTMVPTILPSAWGGRIPPLTVPGRHRKLDAYVMARQAPAGPGRPVFVDIGCGFPPVTTVETARALPDWQVIGIDRFFADYVVYDREGHYACFDGEGRFQYFQPLMTRSGMALYADPAATRAHFETIWAALVERLSNGNRSASQTVTADGHRLVHHQIRDFEGDNLTFIQGALGALDLPPARVIRCMNVLIYSPADLRARLLAQMGDALEDGGLLMAGTSGFGIDARYTLLRKRADDLRPQTFAFGLENLRSFGIMPYFTLHADDREAALLASLMGLIRAEKAFWPAFSRRVDQLLETQGVCRRGTDGFLTPAPAEMPHAEIRERVGAVWQRVVAESYREKAAAVLTAAGHSAWVNAAGDIAVRPPAGFKP